MITIIIIITYFIVGRIFSQIYINIEDLFADFDYAQTKVILTIFWPILLLWWAIDSLIEWINYKFF